MKNLILATAALVAVTGSALASGQTPANGLSKVDAAELRFYVRNVDVDKLTPAQVQSVQSALYGDDKGKVAALKAAVR